MTTRLLFGTAIILCLGGTAVSAEALKQHQDAEGNVHYGTSDNPDLCCMCRPVVRYESRHGHITFFLPYGIERIVGNDRVFLSADGKAWYCEGAREMGRSSQKCGLIPPVM